MPKPTASSFGADPALRPSASVEPIRLRSRAALTFLSGAGIATWAMGEAATEAAAVAGALAIGAAVVGWLAKDRPRSPED